MKRTVEIPDELWLVFTEIVAPDFDFQALCVDTLRGELTKRHIYYKSPAEMYAKWIQDQKKRVLKRSIDSSPYVKEMEPKIETETVEPIPEELKTI